MSFTVKVTDIDKTAKDIQFRLDYSTTLAQYSKEPSQTNLARRVSDLQWLLSQLASAYPECFLPPLPACLTGKTVVSVSAGYYNAIPSAQVDDRVKECVQLMLTQIVSHPTYVSSSCVQQFFESGNQFVPYTMKQSNSVSKFFKSAIKSVKSVKEVDQWYDDCKMETTEVHTQIDCCCKALEKLVKADRALGVSYADLASKLLDYGAEEPSVQLTSSLRKFSVLMGKSASSYAALGELESLYTSDVFLQHSQSLTSVEQTLENRLSSLQDYDNACKATQKRKQAADKLKTVSQVKHDKVDAALTELTDAKQSEAEAKDFVQRISDTIKHKEWPALLKMNESALLATLSNHARIQIASERQQVKEYESTLQEISSIRSTAAFGDSVLTTSSGAANKIPVDVL